VDRLLGKGWHGHLLTQCACHQLTMLIEEGGLDDVALRIVAKAPARRAWAALGDQLAVCPEESDF
jgi:hypothetical protein